MPKPRLSRSRLFFFLLTQALIALVAVAVVSATTAEPLAPPRAELLPADTALALSQPADVASPQAPAALQLSPETTLTVAILSSPWATLDHNNPTGAGDNVPQVFVVEAVVTNTGNALAENITVTLTYSSDNWVLLTGEDPERTVDELAKGEGHHFYWFARYPTTIGASHRYTVTADASNANAFSTSDNYYGNPEPGATVKTRSALSTGNSGVTQVSADITVGVAFTVTISYDLGTDPQELALSPVGNPDFDPTAYRLLASQVRFYDDGGTTQGVVHDRLYFPSGSLPPLAQNAEATYTFIAVIPANTRLCSYTTVGYGTTQKYDQFYCDEKKGTIIPIEGRLSLSLTKEALPSPVQQNQFLTYTLRYTNTGNLPLQYVWFWDEVNTDIGSIVSPADNPPDEIEWDIGPVPAAGEPGYTGTLTFTILVDGNQSDLIDQTPLVNHAYFGINQGSRPKLAALTTTLTTTIQAPAISIAKTDGRETVEPGEALTYTLRITNTGSVSATAVVITDELPAHVIYQPGTASEPETSLVGQKLVWDNLGPIPPGGGTIAITIPVMVGQKVPNGQSLLNQAAVEYQNPAGWPYTIKSAQDATTVTGPLLTVSKTDAPDPVLTGRWLTYTLHYENKGPTPATEVLITDVVPLSTTNPSCGGGSSCSISGGIVTWTVDSIAANSSGSVQFSVRVSDTLQTGTILRNNDYGIISRQTDYYSGPEVTTEVRRDAAFFVGYAYVDANGSGDFQQGTEQVLQGITITLPSATVPVTYTNEQGYYRFRVEDQDPITISAALPPGYFRTTPGAIIFAEPVLGITKTVNFGYAPVTSTFGVVFGTVFEDEDHDGQQETGENGLAGVQVSSTLAVTSPQFTDDLGWYTFRYDAPGTATITETNPPNYVSTTPDIIQTAVMTGSDNNSPYDFGDFLGIKISGQVWNDQDVDGAKDLTEEGLADAVVSADGESYTTDSSGLYALYLTPATNDPISVTEDDPPGYLSTSAIPGNDMVRFDANTLVIPSPMSGTVYADGDFGDVLARDAITISGQVWEDNGACAGCLANGLLDVGEEGLAGAVVSLSSGLTQTTDADGLFLLYAPAGEPITVTETNPDGYVSTNAIPGNEARKIDNDTLVVRPLAGGSTSANNLFGDVLAGSVSIISGTVFDDANENGLLDGGETGLAGVTVTLQIRTSTSPISVLTSPAGTYQFAVAPGTDARITSSGPGGAYYPTMVESVVVRPTTPGPQPAIDFGYSDDQDVSVIYGLVFDDIDGDGLLDLGDLGLGGAVITLTLDAAPVATVTTTSNGLLAGTFTFSVTKPALDPVVYGVHEKNPPGYVSTTTDDLKVTVTPATPSYYVEFGDTKPSNRAFIHGTVFDDLNGDGVEDPSEPGLPGVVITLTGTTVPLTATTQAYGNYSFRLSQEGLHAVREQDPAKAGYHSTTPDIVPVDVEFGRAYDVDFGDTMAEVSNIVGIVFEDISQDGVHNPLSEPGISGVTITLSSGASTATGAYGQYGFPVAVAGAVQVIETDPPGYHSTTPNTVNVLVADPLGQSYRVNFGDRQTGLSFFGTVFEDQNINGLREASEPGLAGVTVTITGPFDPPPDPYLTNQWGQYTFPIETVGTYTVTETDPEGYVSTIAIPADPEVSWVDDNTLQLDVTSLTPPRDFGDNLFGDALASQAITISGYVWNDNGTGGGTAGDGLRNGSEPGLAAAVISLSSGLVQTTGADGQFLLYAPASELITVTETNPDGYVSTAAIPGNGAAGVDNDTLEIGPLAGGSTSSDNRFGDVLPADLQIEKTASPNPVVAGTVLTYTLDYTNQGPSYAQSLLITDSLPAEVIFGGVVSQPGYLSDPAQTGQLLAWEPFTLTSGVSGSIVLTVTVKADTISGTVLVNSAGITSNHPDTKPADNRSSVETMVTSEANLSLDKVGSSATTLAGQPFTYTLTIANDGPSDATGIVVTDTLPAGMTLAGASGATCPAAGQEITCVPFDILYGEEPVVITLSVDVEPSVAHATLLTNTAAARGDQFDPDLTDNTDSTTTTVNRLADLALTKGDEPDPVAAGATLTYTLAYTNYGPSDALNAYLTDTLDTRVTFGGIVEQPSSWISFDQTANTLTWYAPSLPAGESGAIVFTVTVKASAVGSILNTGRLDSETQDNVANNNQSETTTYVGDPNKATIYGYVFQDDNCNGKWDTGERALADPDVSLTVPTSLPPAYGDGGLFYFITDQPGVHVVVESDAAGYFSTTPNKVHLAVTLGQSFRVDFGDALTSAGCAAVYGTVFEDLDSSGSRDAGELGIRGVTITLDGTTSVTTGLYGRYTLPTAQEGAHTVVETDPAGYMSTTPNEVDLDVTLGAGFQVDFGDVSFCTCDGDEYEEDDTPQQAVALTVGETQTHNFCDDITDWTYLQAEARQTYTITTSSWGQRADTYLALYDTDGKTLLVATDDFAGTDDYSSRIVWWAPRDGTYYLLATNRAGLMGCDTGYDLRLELSRTYFLFLPLITRNAGETVAEEPHRAAATATEGGQDTTILLGPTGIITHTCQDPFEIDDTWTIAQPIEDGEPQLHSFDSNPAEWAADKDFVWFDLQRGRTITFTVTAVTNTSTLLELYDSQGEALNVTGTTELVWTAPALGRYYLSVSPLLATYGCIEPVEGRPVVSYRLQADWEPRTFLYLPIVVRTYSAP